VNACVCAALTWSQQLTVAGRPSYWARASTSEQAQGSVFGTLTKTLPAFPAQHPPNHKHRRVMVTVATCSDIPAVYYLQLEQLSLKATQRAGTTRHIQKNAIPLFRDLSHHKKEGSEQAGRHCGL